MIQKTYFIQIIEQLCIEKFPDCDQAVDVIGFDELDNPGYDSIYLNPDL
jgi:hypothetical protein